MSTVNGKRITFKRTRPNPLFQDWLEELHEEAKQKNNKLEMMLSEALVSLSKYPLPLQSGGECAILRGFDKRLCLYLDKRLEAYNSFKINSDSNFVTSEENLLCSQNSNKDILNLNSSQESNQQSKGNCYHIGIKKKKDKIKYKPAFRSGSYAILMALLDHTTHGKHSLNKDDLIELAQKYSEESFTKPKSGTYYNAWSNMKRLITKGLVEKIGHKKSQFALTEQGISIANELHIDAQNTPTMNDVIFKDSSNDKINDIASEIVVLNDINEKNCSFTYSEQKYDLKNSDKLIEMEPGTFDIILLIDKNETGGVSKKNDPTVAQFNKYPDLKHEYRSLKVGDFTWIALHKISKKELVLPYIVERKRMDDLGASIKDGRFHEQKFRLRKCGLNNVIYMVENYGSNKQVGLPVHTLMQALANTRVQDGFKVQVTDSLTHSARFLAMMTLRLTFEYKDKRLHGHNKEPKNDILTTFEFFNKAALKNKPLTVTDTFIKLLLQLKGVSVEKALAITNVYKTPKLLIEAYKNCNCKEGEILLANLKCNEMSRNVGPTVSKSIYQLFTFKDFS